MLFRSKQLWQHIIYTYHILFLSKSGFLTSSVAVSASSERFRVVSTRSCANNVFSVLKGNKLFSDLNTYAHYYNRMSSKNHSSQENTNSNNNTSTSLPEKLTVHTANITEVHNVPIKILIRPIPSVLDEDKVLSIMETIRNPETEDNVPPIDIMWVKGRQGGDYYYSFGGCHRYEAYKRLKRENIPCKLFKSSIESLRPYLGGSTPDLI